MFLPDPSGHRDVALGLCRDAGRVLLVLNARSVQGLPARFWDLPGGSALPGETLRAALAREWEEEVGWAPAVGDLVLTVDGRKRTASDAPPLYTWRAFVFDVAPAPFGTMPRPGPEIEKIEHVQESHLAMRLAAPYHAPLRAFLAGGPRYAAFDWIEPASAEPPPLSAEARRLCVLASAAACGDLALVASEAAAALGDAVPAARIEEALLQVVPYAGFPRALAAFAAARGALGASGPGAGTELPPASAPERGTAAFAAVYADSAPRVREGLRALHPLLPAWTADFAYGRVLSRDALDLATRELLAVALLTALGRCDDALLGHMRAAVRLGVPRDAVAGAITVVPSSAGEGKRAAARAVLDRL
jgi:alkylhydroperoxidase/carboxymuconolactone decarboxylase family protein YurZ/8-oxo-dGTP pyrophosphatase MutT (NUDIX family)